MLSCGHCSALRPVSPAQYALTYENGCVDTHEYPLDCPTFMNGVVHKGLHGGIVKFASLTSTTAQHVLSLVDTLTPLVRKWHLQSRLACSNHAAMLFRVESRTGVRPIIFV